MRMLGYQNLEMYSQPAASHASHDATRLFDRELEGMLDISLTPEVLSDEKRYARNKASWSLRMAKRQARIFRLRRAGELAMSTTVASLGTFAVVESLAEGKAEGAAIGLFGIIWCLGVAREVVRDFKSLDYNDLVGCTTQARKNYNAAFAFPEIKPSQELLSEHDHAAILSLIRTVDATVDLNTAGHLQSAI